MLRLTRRPLVALAILVVAAALPAATSANNAWGSYHWSRSANPLALNVGDNVGSAWDAYLDEAIADWNRSSVIELTKVAGGNVARPKQCRPTSGRIEVCAARYGNNGWLGLAQIWISGSHITQATSKMNDTYFETPTYNTPAWRELVMCQEIAHDFGLDHQDEDFDNQNLGSCMDYTSDPDGPPSNGDPNQHDYDQLEAIYSHLDGAAAAPPRGAGAGQGWGREVARLGNGRASIYVLELGRGQRVVTHVIWAR